MNSKTTINCKIAGDWTSEALDERLSASEAKAFREHILACRDCHRAFDSLKTLSGWTRKLPRQTLSQGFAKTLQQRIASGEGSPVAALMSPMPGIQKLTIFMSGAITAAAILLGFLLLYDVLQGDNEGTDTNPSSSSLGNLAHGNPYAANIRTAAVEIENMKREIRNLDDEPERTLRQIEVRGNNAAAAFQDFLAMIQRGPFKTHDALSGMEDLLNAQSKLVNLKQLFEQHSLPNGISSMGNNGKTLLRDIKILIYELPDPKELVLRFPDNVFWRAESNGSSSYSNGRLKPERRQGSKEED